MHPSNVAMLRNAIDAVEAAAPNLQHVHLVEGQKWYDVRLRPPRTPTREDDPRHMDTTKLRLHGFHGVADTGEQLTAYLQQYREAKLLP